MLYMDDDEIIRAQKTGEYQFKGPDDIPAESPGLRDFKAKRKERAQSKGGNSPNMSP